MRKAFYLFVFAVLVTIAACKEDKCDGVVCLNGGTCQEGECACNSKYTGPTCELFTNPCDSIPCHNGRCDTATRTCNCYPHWSGDSCTIQETPSKMYITGVTFDHFHPSSITGIPWDADDDGSPADIYPIIRKNGVVVYNGHTESPFYAYKQNANYDTRYFMPFHEDSIAISGSDIYSPEWRVELWDYDNGFDDDLMEGRNFTPYTDSTGFRGSVEVNDTSFYHDKFQFRVHFSPWYEW